MVDHHCLLESHVAYYFFLGAAGGFGGSGSAGASSTFGSLRRVAHDFDPLVAVRYLAANVSSVTCGVSIPWKVTVVDG